MFDLSEITYVKRVTLGSRHPEQLLTDEDIEAAQALLNRCLSDMPKGRLIGQEKSFTMLDIHGNIVVLQCVCYHVGFTRKPAWLTD